MKQLLPLFFFLSYNPQQVFLTPKRANKNILGIKHIQIGEFSNEVYKGTWRSAQKLQSDHLESQEGTLYLAINNSSPHNQFQLILELYEGFFKENRFLIVQQQFVHNNFDVKNLNLQQEKASIKAYTEYDSFHHQKECDL